MTEKELLQVENREWQESIQWIIDHESEERVRELLDLLRQTAENQGISLNQQKLVGMFHSLPLIDDADFPGDLSIEDKINSAIRWNAMAMVVNANRRIEGIGGHISTYSSASHLFETGFQHFFKGYDKGSPDLVFFQGHASPGIYARSFLEHRFEEEHLDNFRQEIKSGKGLSSYPHPKLMPEYWRFPTVSMGLGPIQAIYQARFIKYLKNNQLIEESDQKVWAFLGDGEMDEPESTGAITIASRDKLDNLIFVINCNLQRLDGPVRGNTQVITELASLFQGAGWKVIQVIWGGKWKELFQKDKKGKLEKLLSQMPDGERQRISQMGPEKLKEELFAKNDLAELVENWSHEDFKDLVRGGHDPIEVYRAYKEAVNSDTPVVILAQTVKGYDQGSAGEASNVTHKQKKFKEDQLKAFRDTLKLSISDEELEKETVPYFRYEKDSEEFKYLKQQRKKLGGWLPARKQLAKKFKQPKKKIFDKYAEGSGDKEVNTTSVFVEILSKLMQDKETGQQYLPIVPDESRTFGMDSLFGKAGIYDPEGQNYKPVDKGSLLYYNQKKSGRLIEEGITEAGSLATFMAAGTNHYSRDFYMVPFFVYYSMFGFQRVGDLLWAALDAGARGFLIGGISGRTSLSGEGLQHTDGSSHLYALAYPDVRAYDPAFAYELAVIVQHGLKIMYSENKDELCYITITNQAMKMPATPRQGLEDEIISGLYTYKKSRKRKNKKKTINLLGSGAIMKEVLRATDLLEDEFDIPVNIWSVTSYKALYDDMLEANDLNLENSKTKKSYVSQKLGGSGDYFLAASDYVRALPMSIATEVPGEFEVLGTDGYGPSDTTPKMRAYFHIDAKNIVKSAVKMLIRNDQLNKKELKKLDNLK